ncbi:MAG: hypothetical protein JKY60_01170 [Kordiimonadaceae bacterium]|nr:hypothetical protein [Kordiimonadaceae bacterium]
MMLAKHFLSTYAEEEHKTFKGFSAEIEAHFRAQDWPGNVRELQNVIRNITVMHDGPYVLLSMLPDQNGPVPMMQNSLVLPSNAPVYIEGLSAPPTGLENLPSILKSGSLDDIERLLIEGRIAAHMNSIPKAAESLGVSPSTIYRKKERWDALQQAREEAV